MIKLLSTIVKKNTCLQIISGILIDILFLASLSQAQVIQDETLSTNVSSSDGLNYVISGGSQAGENLFHSFQNFSVPLKGSASFDNVPNVRNIISRVTGGFVSDIDGLIKANFGANLFLINPNGIIFGSEAQLDIGGSFIASTANQINFADGKFIKADNSQLEPLLTISMPIGLKIGEKAGVIRNESKVNALLPELEIELPGLSVNRGKTLALIGSGVFIEGGGISSPGGRIEVGSIVGPGLVNLIPVDEGWSFGYEGLQNFDDIIFSREATILTSSEGSGAISLNGKRIIFEDSSSIVSVNFGVNPSKKIFLNASDLVQVSKKSSLSSISIADTRASDIIIKAKSLIIDDAGTIESVSEDIGSGGDITVTTSDFIDIRGGSFLSRLTTNTSGMGHAGNVKITTDTLFLRDGGQISTSTSNAGNAGQLTIDASKSVEVRGQSEDSSISGLFSQTRGSRGRGNAGKLIVNTEQLVVRDGGKISVGSVRRSQGQGGELLINASEVDLVGSKKNINGDLIESTLLAESEGIGNAGNLIINSNKLMIRDGAKITVSSAGGGAAGDIKIFVSDFLLDDKGVLKAETTKGEGNIVVQANDIVLRRNSRISTNATGEARGGNVTINTGVLVALENSDITANSKENFGGRVSISARGIFGTQFREKLTPESDITASSKLGPNFSGTVELDITGVDPNQGLIDLPTTVVDPRALVAQNPCKRASSSEFTRSGRGGLPPSISQDLNGESIQVGLVEPVNVSAEKPELKPNLKQAGALPQSFSQISPAQGWVYNNKGEVVLVAYNSAVTGPQRLQSNPKGCPVL